MSVPHPIPYQGSKRRLAPTILRYVPTDARRVIEPFAGSAAVTLACAASRAQTVFLLSDLNAALMGLWHEIIEAPARISEAYAELWHAQEGRERDFYDEVRGQFNRTGRPDLLLYLLARCVKASVRYNADGEFNQSPDNRRKGANPATMEWHIHSASGLLKGRSLVKAADYREALAEATSEDLVYMDPPYQGVCGNRDPRYVEGVKAHVFSKTLEDLNRRRVSYLLSYDGRTGAKTYGKPLPASLELHRIEVDAGPSSQATLLGRPARTYESLYLSPALSRRLGDALPEYRAKPAHVVDQMSLFGEVA